jgi:cellulose synthase/poly-beta-1,6-N-acetylglucosamine synthase-like glycosyltransferase
MEQDDSRLQVVHVKKLPHGWLGKNYALSRGVQQAKGEFFLFTDADVVMEQSTVSKALGHMVDQQLDHIAMAPEVRMPGILLEMFVNMLVSVRLIWCELVRIMQWVRIRPLRCDRMMI